MKRSDERILTTHVGSIIRPESLLALASQKVGPPKDVTSYEAVLREAVADVVRKQVATGIDIVNDGEYGKSSWAHYVLEGIKGFEVRQGRIDPRDWLGRERERFPELVEAEFGQFVRRPLQACVAPIEYQAISAVRCRCDKPEGCAFRQWRGRGFSNRGRSRERRIQRHRRVLSR